MAGLVSKDTFNQQIIEMAVEQMENAESVSAKDLAVFISELRSMRGWSQDTLAAVSKLSMRTAQRVENGEP